MSSASRRSGVLIATLALAGVAGAAPAPPPSPTVPVAPATAAKPLSVFDRVGGAESFRPTERGSWTARLVKKTQARRGAGAGKPAGPVIFADAPYAGLPHVFKVLDAAEDARGGAWYKVLLPSRPNDAAAWLPESVLELKRTPWRVVVNVRTARAELLRGGRVQERWKVAVGTATYPTPVGRFAISEIVAQPNPSGFYGPYIITLTAHSNRLNDFDGGDGRVALHGTNIPRLLGSRASHGCVRLPNSAAATLARSVPPGTPVDIVTS